MNLLDFKNEMLKNKLSPDMEIAINTLCQNPKKPLGKFNMANWCVEVVRGCNLRCWHCATRLFPKGKYDFMSIDTFKNFMNVVKEVTPYNRIEFANAGEPTLHPQLYELLKIGREISPQSFFHVVSNGTMLLKNVVSYDELFNAGANIVYVDMYNPEEQHIALAKKSGYNWYLRYEKKPDHMPSGWTYYSDMNIKCIILQKNPSYWSNQKKNTGFLSTMLNDMDWPKAEKKGLKPVTLAPLRRCKSPMKTGNVGFDGLYGFCCFDFMRHSYGKLNSVNNGIDGFIQFWFGQYMQEVRKLLHNKDRRSHEQCSKCDFIGSRGDIPVWTDNMFEYFLNENNEIKENNVVPKNLLKTIDQFFIE